MGTFTNWGKRIYNMENASERRRFVIFILRSWFNKSAMNNLISFFYDLPIKREIIEATPFFIEQATRQFFYKGSTLTERCQIIKDSMSFMTDKFSEDTLRQLYVARNGIKIWQEEYQGGNLFFELRFEPGQRKEATLSILLRWNDLYLYRMMFWIVKDKVTDEDTLYIGAMQGPDLDQANEIIKGLTKRFFGYRPKNLILYATRAFARAAGLKKIYAVTNTGYYANNHLRRDRKLKTSFSDFWAETGGIPCEDERFYELPLIEYRKSIEEIKTHKRSQYRKRFAVLDEIDQSVNLMVQGLLR